MTLLIFVVFGLCAMTALVVVAVGIAVSRASDHEGETSRLAWLGRLHSPSGKSFFPDDDSVLALAETLDEANDVPARPRRV
jgi:hypothetical protein